MDETRKVPGPAAHWGTMLGAGLSPEGQLQRCYAWRVAPPPGRDSRTGARPRTQKPRTWTPFLLRCRAPDLDGAISTNRLKISMAGPRLEVHTRGPLLLGQAPGLVRKESLGDKMTLTPLGHNVTPPLFQCPTVKQSSWEPSFSDSASRNTPERGGC